MSEMGRRGMYFILGDAGEGREKSLKVVAVN